ncbi:TonB-dependent receptor [Sphingosinicella microcystinivorans]|uniref:Outer membrane receptor protein involved in Fe transport n=2 Tax=Sphingosinicella microcystinivorans TaxID=335406 RepID=A0AAD1D6J6_SPHMI|nr:TonB-dependent receptor [Sphingosinicella microcystinivorans]RKS91183.1 outer membrane receptor protein involved in Fe transport [Sphingosinicella microcystinivorans]BBE34149.1 TonB-dependent receptor [Sphingosinicella microcystinivorans]
MKAGLFASVSAAAFFASSVTAMAQTTGAEASAESTAARDIRRDEDIIVTATRRTEKLQDVPLSVTAFGQEDLDDLGIVGYEGIAQNTPGIVVNRPTQNFNNFTSRGINTNGYSAGLQSAVAIYVDELPISANGNSTILDPNLYDVERVEFLRGPQGTLFGSNSLAGAMRILTRSPDLDEFQASASVDLGLTGSSSVRQRYNAMLNVPLMTDQLGLRVTGYYRNEDGWIDNVGTGIKDSNSLEAYGGRAILLMQPSDRMKVKLLASYENSKPADSALTNPTLGRFTRRSDRPDLFQGKLTNYNVTVNYEFDFAELISSTTLSDYDASFYVDLAGTFAQTIPFALDAYGYDDLFVQETRLVSRASGPIQWVAGFFYYDKRRTVDFAYRSTQEFLDARGLTGLPDEYYQRFNSYTDQTEMAGFGEVSVHFTDNFWITGGLRYGRTEVQSFTRGGGYNSNYLTYALFGVTNAPLTVTPVNPATGLKVSDDRVSYKASVSWKPMPDLTTYATISTGFRTPVVNARAGLVSAINPSDIVIPAGAKSDGVTNYEVGIKGRWLGGDLTTNLAAYYIDWKDIQVQANRVSDSIQFATNIGGAESYGLEFEVVAKPVQGLSLAFNGSFNRAKVTELSAIEAAISGAEPGVRLASPRFQGSSTLRYDFSIGNDRNAFASVNVSHTGAFPNQFPNVPGNPNAASPTYDYTEAWTNVNLYAGAKLGSLDLTAYVENLFDDSSITYVHPEAFLDGRYARLRPRTVGVRANYRF